MTLNKQLKKLLFSLLFLVSVTSIFSQELTTKAGVSVITCGPGDVLYTTFGHSALRVYDHSIGLDKVYNYGTFDFNAPNFYLNFAKGKLTYQLSTTHFHLFLSEYKYSNRWVKIQDLNLTNEEVKAVFAFLENNARPENMSYQYDFFFDNCSTKIEEVLKSAIPNKLTFKNNHIKSEKTHRDLIADYTQQQKWGKFGIDLALGSVIDRKATKDEYKFLPDYIFQALANATIQKDELLLPLVKKEQTIIEVAPTNEPQFLVSFSPLLVITLISLLIIFITYKNYQTKKRSKWLDFFLYFITGIIGIIVLLMWFATTHTATYKNLNFLWAFAPNLVVSFWLLKTNMPNWIKTYSVFLLGLLVVMLFVWIVKIQVFNTALIPLVIALATRYLFIWKHHKTT